MDVKTFFFRVHVGPGKRIVLTYLRNSSRGYLSSRPLVFRCLVHFLSRQVE